MDPAAITPTIIGGAAAVVVAFLTVLGVVAKAIVDRLNARDAAEESGEAARDARKREMEKYVDERTKELFDAQDRKISQQHDEITLTRQQFGALARVFQSVVPYVTDPAGPPIDPADILLLESTGALPINWIRRGGKVRP